MFLQIKKLILWPRHIDAEPRTIDFHLGAVNVITGASKTGKSAIIPIIDYCLGSDECRIPVNTIRKSCEWFGILVATATGEFLLARREPGNQKSTGDMYVAHGTRVEVPRTIIEKNTNAEFVKHTLDELAGLTQLDFGDGGFSERPSFRDMAAFTFQPQNVIANRDVLFFKADTYRHREKLKTIFPYVLNAITPETMAKEHELKRLRTELTRKERELEGVRRVSERWVAEIQAKITTARELGLLARDTPVPADFAGRIDLLRRLAAEGNVEGRVTADSVTDAAKELVGLRNEEADLSRQLALLKRRVGEMTGLKEVSERYREAVGIKRDRLRISEWFQGLHEESSECPVCGNKIVKPEDEVGRLVEALKASEIQAGQGNLIPAAFDREFQRVRDEMTEVTGRLTAVSIRRRAIERQSQQIEQQQFQAREAWRFVGELGEAISRLESIRSDGVLAEEVETLRSQTRELSSEVQRARIDERVNDALSKVSLFVGRLLPDLDVEREEDPVSLVISELTIRVSGDDRNDFLWEIGSAANALSYHVAVTLALHKLFRGFPNSPVPGFIVFDQPSQVYFPRKAGTEKEEGFDPKFYDEDVQAVRRVFEVVGDAVKESKGKLQAIILDHAPMEVWRGIDNVHLVAEWREGRKLVPADWIR